MLLHKVSVKISIPHSSVFIAKLDKNNKPGMLTEEHCMIVGHVAKVFRYVLPTYIRKFLLPNIALWCALHDIGKISPGFLKRIYRELLKTVFPELYNVSDSLLCPWHSEISEASARDYFSGLSSDSRVRACTAMLGIHHGIKSIPDGSTVQKYGGLEWENERRKLTQKLMTVFGNPIFRSMSRDLAEINSAYIALCDWIGSGLFPASGNVVDIHKTSLKVIRSLGWKKSVIRKGLSFTDIWPNMKPYEMQKAFIESVTKQGVYILEASPGRGKTEAALYSAYKLLCAGINTGIFYALPTRMTSDQMYKRFEQFLTHTHESGVAPKLIHGLSLISDIKKGKEDEGNYACVGNLTDVSEWFTPNRQAMILPFGVGTIDQLLLSVLNTKFNFIRTFGLVGKVIIIDEVHAYDTYTSELIDVLVKKLRRLGCTVIILSATLTKKRKQELLECKTVSSPVYPLITTKKAGVVRTKKCGTEPHKTCRVRKIIDNTPLLLSTATKKALEGQQIVWLCNTVDKSVAIYKALRDDPTLNSLVGENRIALIHSRFPKIHKTELEEYWTKRLGKFGVNRISGKDGSILIGTQVLEQSINIDGDFMLSDLAPSDLMLQRLGRLWRYTKHKRLCKSPEFWISCPDLSNIQSSKDLRKTLGTDALIYAPYILWRSYQIWRRKGSVRVPDDMVDTIERTYRDYTPQDPTWLREAWDQLEDHRQYFRDLANVHIGSQVIGSESDDDDLSLFDVCDEMDDDAKTRINSYPMTTLMLTKSLKDMGDYVHVEFPNGCIIESPKNKRDLDVIKATLQWQVRVPQTKMLRNVESPEWLTKASYRFPVPVYIDMDSLRLYKNGFQHGGLPIEYKYETDCGVYKPKEVL